MNNAQNVGGFVFSVLLIVGLIVWWIAQPGPTAEEIQAEADLLRAEVEASEVERLQQELEDEREHRQYLEREAAKTPEQKAIEAEEKHSIDTGEAVVGAAGIAAGAYIFGKMLDGI